MIKLNVTPGTLAANDTIPLTMIFNTNNSLNLSNNQIVIRKAGFPEIEGTITLIGTAAGDVQVQLVDGSGTVLTSQTASFTAIGDYATIPVYDLLRIIYNGTGINEKVSLVVNSAVTINNGLISVKYID